MDKNGIHCFVPLLFALLFINSLKIRMYDPSQVTGLTVLCLGMVINPDPIPWNLKVQIPIPNPRVVIFFLEQVLYMYMIWYSISYNGITRQSFITINILKTYPLVPPAFLS